MIKRIPHEASEMENSAGCSALNLQSAAGIIGRWIRKVWRRRGAGLSHAAGLGYGAL